MSYVPVLDYAFQLILVGGVPSVFLVGFVTKGLFASDDGGAEVGPRFGSEYDELMWLAEKQRLTPLNDSEISRFYVLRESWPAMHRYLPRPPDGS